MTENAFFHNMTENDISHGMSDNADRKIARIFMSICSIIKIKAVSENAGFPIWI